jgi:hypothetical protein
MNLRWLAWPLCGVALCVLVSAQAEPAPKDEGWIDLMPGKGLKGWARVPIAPDTEVGKKNPWRLSKDGKVLHCAGKGVKEMLLQQTPRGDGTFHVEWRFKKVEGKPAYNGGVYVRTSRDGRVWLQAQVAHVAMPPQVGDLFGDTLVKGRVKRIVEHGTGTKQVHPPGEWNVYDIDCKGKTIVVRLNGKEVTRWDACEVPVGHVGLQAELYDLDFRNLRFKPRTD